MEAKDLFTAAVQLGEQLRVEECDLQRDQGVLTLRIGFVRGSKFEAPGQTHQLGLPVLADPWTEGCVQAFGVLRPTLVLSAKAHSQTGAVSSLIQSNLWTFGHTCVLQALTGSTEDIGPIISVCPALVAV